MADERGGPWTPYTRTQIRRALAAEGVEWRTLPEQRKAGLYAALSETAGGLARLAAPTAETATETLSQAATAAAPTADDGGAAAASRESDTPPLEPSPTFADARAAVAEGRCGVCGVAHTCTSCGAPRVGPDAHDEPLCSTCRTMDAWRNGEGDTDVIEHARSTALVRQSLMPTRSEWTAIETMAAYAFRANQVRAKQLNTEADVGMVFLAARDLGISPTMALQKIHVIEGKPTLSAELMVALVRQAGYSIMPVELTVEKAIVLATRGAESATITFTMDDARTARLEGKDNWKKNPRAMLWARAVSMACRMLFPDVLAGLTYTPEELGGDDDGVIDADSWENETPAPQPVNRPVHVPGSDVPLQNSVPQAEQDPTLLPADDTGFHDHDGSGLCCLAEIKGRIDALHPIVKQGFQDAWMEARANGLPVFPQLRYSDIDVVGRLLEAAEAARPVRVVGVSGGPEHPSRTQDDPEPATSSSAHTAEVFDTSPFAEAEVVDDALPVTNSLAGLVDSETCPACGMLNASLNPECDTHETF